MCRLPITITIPTPARCPHSSEESKATLDAATKRLTGAEQAAANAAAQLAEAEKQLGAWRGKVRAVLPYWCRRPAVLCGWGLGMVLGGTGQGAARAAQRAAEAC